MTSVIAERCLGGGIGSEDTVHVGQFQDHLHLRLDACDPEVSTGLPGGLEAADQCAKPGRGGVKFSV
ncbi:hypothetical protein NicSoilE8_33210 [Arthrobacter sp. NicSoilE8]|nr:hypothetical protein NicSoilE8_33210 [Arthrobacter sp. NicSoilE8]